MTHTAAAPITTTARRIARELNSRPAHFRVAFDAEGRVTGHVYGQHVDTSGLVGAHILDSRPDSRGGRWTQADVQAFLDEDQAV